MKFEFEIDYKGCFVITSHSIVNPKKAPVTVKQVAEKYNISITQVWRIWTGENWNDAEANVGGDGGDGRANWCQETQDGGDSDRRVNRGYGRVSDFASHGSANTSSSYGFRLILELKD